MPQANPAGRVHQPLLEKEAGRAGPSQGHNMTLQRGKPHQHPPWFYIVTVDLINLLMTAAEIALVLYLTVHHIQEHRGVIGVAMLAPILLNFIGVTYFFSDPNERAVFERVGTTRMSKDLLQVPVLGPVFAAFKVLMISSGLSKKHDIEYERFEASAVKMRQAQTFFSAAPEAVVQLSVLLVSLEGSISLTHILEILVVVVSVFTLAESNVYALRSNYFRLFHTYEEGDHEVHESFGRKCILFFHSFSSIGSRIAASACLIAGVQCFSMREAARRMAAAGPSAMPLMPPTPPRLSPPPSRQMSHGTWGWGRPIPLAPMAEEREMEAASTEQLALAIALALIALILYHMILYYIARLLRYSCSKQDIPGGCYESVNYGWRSTILHTGFQSRNLATQLFFYFENCCMFAAWWLSVQYFGNPRIKKNTHFPMTLSFIVSTVLSIFFLFAAVGARMHRLESPFKVKRNIPASVS